ncbi:calcineurin-like phosphoesterase family protein [Frigoribacterium sp. PhB107]|uniref:FN3 domain-containing metallophosphoesterase family protein n=1 Tax=Frigoribacterium sp. PhB107 TaxID=2485172 RepID=UPI000F46086A|nr:FN3 domain-containing metallophosphoesterase family protein [Frigoribacterium sp. PhB107]ROP77421.1 calcineurin-like phosphoesterase family protein [Frigoribacterium sp. PhB107]
MTTTPTAARRPRHRARVAAALLLVTATAVGATSTVTSARADDAVPLLTTESTAWSYLETGVDPSAGSTDPLSWTADDFDDSQWKNAQGSFGAKGGKATGMGGGYAVDTLLQQYLPGGTVDVPTYFFRSSLELTADQLAGWKSLTADVVYDDALVVYVNGTKVVGYEDSRIADFEGNVGYAGDGGGDPDRSTFTIDPALLHAGENTVSVALYQDRSTSSDIYFDFLSLTPVSASAEATISDVFLNVGADESQRAVSWYSDSTSAEEAQLALTKDVTGGVFPARASSFASTSGVATDGQNWHHATLTGLVPSTSYSYRVGSDADGWSETYVFETQATGDYGFLFIGDAQIGAGETARDTAGWVETMGKASGEFPDTSFVLSAGDQVNTASNELQYDGFLAPSQTKTLPFATNIGNHDVASKAYEQHFAMPNVSETAGRPDAARAGGDYWFIYQDTLYISFNSNDRDDAGHADFARKVIAEHGDEARWTIVTFHHSVYSVASHATDGDIVTRRAELPPVMSELDVDLVLMGHDHVYVRSYLMSGTTPVHTDEPVDGTVAPEGDEVLYVTANSSSGSKYYDIQSQDFDFSAVQNQEYTPNFTNVEVTADSIAMTTYRTTDMAVVDEVTLSRPADPTEPPVDPTDPTTPPVDPTTPPVDPTTPPVDPGTGDEDPTAVPLSELTEATHTLVVTAVDEAEGTLTATVPRRLAGAALDWFVHSEPVYLGDDPSDDDGVLTLRLPEGLGAGTHTLVGQTDATGAETWGTFELTAVSDPLPGTPGAGGAGSGTGADTGAGTSAGGSTTTAQADGALAFTGSDALPLAAGALLVLLAGLALVIRARRRRA